MKIQTILYPTDFSEPSQEALGCALQIAADYGARLIVLHAVETLGAQNVTYGEATSERQPESYRQRLWNDLRRTVHADPGLNVEYLLCDEDPVTGILRVAAERGCDLIVMGTHGRHGMQRLLQGSVAEHVVRGASCPVLIVKPSTRTVPLHREKEAKNDRCQG